MMDWVKQWELILLLTSSCWPHLKFHFSWEKICVHYLQFTSIKTLLILKPSQHSKSPSWSLSRKPVSASSDCLALPNIWKSPVLVCACPKLPNCAGEQPTCAKSWILPLNLQSKPSLSSEIACSVEWLPDDLQQLKLWHNLELRMNSATWPSSCEGLSWSKIAEWSVEFDLWILSRSLAEAQIEDSSELIPTLIHQTALMS